MQKLSIFTQEGFLRDLRRFRDLPKIEPFALSIYNTWIFLDCTRGMPKLDQWSEYPQIFQRLLTGIIRNVIAIHLCYVSFNLQEIWGFYWGWLGQNLSAKTSNWKCHNFCSLRNTQDKCIAKTLQFSLKKVFGEFWEDSEICQKSSILHCLYITHGFLLDCTRVCQNLTNG